jgi:hypothetical protein
MNFLRQCKEKYPEVFRGQKVIEFGSRNINGTARWLFENCDYIGVDYRGGAGVDIVGLAHQYHWHPDGSFNVVVSTEMLEHDPYWKKSVQRFVDLLAIGGSLIITCAGPARPIHHDGGSPMPGWYENRRIDDLLPMLECFYSVESHLAREDKDIYIFAMMKVFNEKNR